MPDRQASARLELTSGPSSQVPEKKKLGEWAGQVKLDDDQKPRKVTAHAPPFHERAEICGGPCRLSALHIWRGDAWLRTEAEHVVDRHLFGMLPLPVLF